MPRRSTFYAHEMARARGIARQMAAKRMAAAEKRKAEAAARKRSKQGA